MLYDFILSSVILHLVSSQNEHSIIQTLIDLYTTNNGAHWRDNTGWNIFESTHTYSPIESLTVESICNSNSIHIILPNSTDTNNSSTTSIPTGIQCTNDAISWLSLRGNNLTGTLPRSICNLFNNNITSIDLSNNKLHGSLPRCFLPTIAYNNFYTPWQHVYFTITGNHLSGRLSCDKNDSRPQWERTHSAVFNKASDKVLSLYKNRFSGPVPECLTDETFWSVDLNHNKLTGDVPSLWHASYVILNDNELDGTIPMKLISRINDSYQFYKEYLVIDLHNNKLTGTIWLSDLLKNVLRMVENEFFLVLNHNMLEKVIVEDVMIDKLEDYDDLPQDNTDDADTSDDSYPYYGYTTDDYNYSTNYNNDSNYNYSYTSDDTYWYTDSFGFRYSWRAGGVAWYKKNNTSSNATNYNYNYNYNDNINSNTVSNTKNTGYYNTTVGEYPTSFKNTTCSVFFHHNQLTNSDIDDILDTLFRITTETWISNGLFDSDNSYTKYTISADYQYLTFDNNDALTGSLYGWKTPAPSTLSVFTLHSCDIGGALRYQKGLLSNTDYITMYGNRLSCYIHPHLLSMDSNDDNDNDNDNDDNDDDNINSDSEYTRLILLGNKFTTADAHKTTLLTNDPFVSATSLYIEGGGANEYFRFSLSLFYLVLSLGIFLFIIGRSCKIKNRIRMKYAEYQHGHGQYNQSTRTIFRTHTMSQKTQSIKATPIIQKIDESDDDGLNNRKFDDRTNYTIANTQFYSELYSMFSNWIMLTLCFMLTVLYFVSNNFYQCGHYLSNFAVTYYHFDRNTKVFNAKEDAFDYITESQLMVAITVVIFNAVVLWYLQQFMTMASNAGINTVAIKDKWRLGNLIRYERRFKPKNKNNSNQHNSSEKSIPLLSLEHCDTTTPYDQHRNENTKQFEVELKLSKIEEDRNNDAKISEATDTATGKDVLKLGLVSLSFLTLYIFGNLLSFIYIIFESLPTDNTFGIDPTSFWIKYGVKEAPKYVITILSVFAVPKMVDKISKFLSVLMTKCKCIICNNNNNNWANKCSIDRYRSYLILFFRSTITLFVPLIASLVLLPECGNNWTVFWTKCNDPKEFTSAKTLDFGGEFAHNVTLIFSSYESICGSDDIITFFQKSNAKIVNECIRSFLDVWTPTICAKLLFYTVTIWIAYFQKKYTSNESFEMISNCLNKIFSKCKCNDKFYFDTFSIASWYVNCRLFWSCRCKRVNSINPNRVNSSSSSRNSSINDNGKSEKGKEEEYILMDEKADDGDGNDDTVSESNYSEWMKQSSIRDEKMENVQKLMMKYEDKSFDDEYASLATKLELFIIFMPFIPFVLPIIMLALYSNYSVFSKITHDLKWQMHAGMIDDQTLESKKLRNMKFWQRFPFKALFGSLIFGQILFVSVVYYVFYQWLNILFIASICTIDVVFVGFNLYQTYKNNC